MASTPLTRAFVAAGGPAPEDVAGHEAKLQSALATARAAWPGVSLDDATVARWLAPRWGGGAVLANASDVALAAACGEGDPAAHAALLAILTRLGRMLRHLQTPSVGADDVRQVLLDRLLVPGPKGVGIARYEGTGPLEAWLRVGLVRTALNLARRGDREEAGELDELARAATLATAPELAWVKQKYRLDFAAAFRQALSARSSRERNLLRLHYLSGVTLDALATMYGVHRATVARWLAAARAAVLSETREGLRATVNLASAELSSLIRALESQLQVSLEPALRSES